MPNILTRILAFLSGKHVGETLHALAVKADDDYSAALNAAHNALQTAKRDLGKVAVTELELLERLIDEAKRRAASLADAGVLPVEHGARLDAVVEKVTA